MSYIGATPLIGNFQKCDAITTSATDTFNLLVGGVAVSPAAPQNCIVSLNGVVQAPTSAYTISGSTIVFASALTTSDVIDFIVILGNVLDLGTPSDDTVTAAKLNDTVISGQTALGAEPADTDEFLVSDAGVLKRVDYSYIKGGGKIGQVVSATKTDTFTGYSAASWGDVTDLTVSITPAATTSKVFVTANIGYGGSSNFYGGFRFVRDSTAIAIGDAAGSRIQSTMTADVSGSQGPYKFLSSSMSYLDSPSTTSATTYKIQMYAGDSGSGEVNVSNQDDDADYQQRSASTITVMEVLA